MDGDEFISEPITPPPGRFDPAGMSRGEPGLPDRFIWRDREHVIIQTLRTWKTSTRSGCGEMYLRRHWFEVTVDSGQRMTLYCERQTRNKKPKQRWYLYSVATTASA